MRAGSPIFVYKILGFHLLLLAVVLALVWGSSSQIYRSARREELLQVRKRQQIIANEACRGIQSYYESIINDLGWIQRRQEAETTRPTNLAQAINGAQPGDAILPRLFSTSSRPLAGRALAELLGDRVSGLFFYNKRNGAVSNVESEEPTTLATQQLPRFIHEWLATVEDTKVSRVMMLNGQEVTLVAASLGNRNPRLLVAIVPGRLIHARFLPAPLMSDPDSALATLVDEQLNVITSASKDMQGLNLTKFTSDEMQAMIAKYRKNPQVMTGEFAEPLQIEGNSLGRRLVTLTPVSISGETWSLFLAYPVDDIDASVKATFSIAVTWAGFFALSITCILVSTAVQMIRNRSRFERVQHELITRELQQARQIQLNWLPDNGSAGPAIDIAAINHPASHISGDFYNWFELPDGRQVITIGDVTGHGMAAAFLMATTQLLVRNTMMRLAEPGAAMEEVNRQLSTQMFRGQFVTMLIMVLDFVHGHIDLCSAGHPSPLIGHDGKYEEVNIEAHLVLGVEPSVHYPTSRIELRPKTNILLYTDGVVDALSKSGKRFSVDKLKSSLGGEYQNAQQLVDAVLKAVSAFRNGRELDDDLTMVAIQVQELLPPTSSDGGVERRSAMTITAGS